MITISILSTLLLGRWKEQWIRMVQSPEQITKIAVPVVRGHFLKGWKDFRNDLLLTGEKQGH